jgi:hypothetical protein
MTVRTHRRRKGLFGGVVLGVAFGVAALALAAPAAAAAPYTNPTIDGGYGVAAQSDLATTQTVPIRSEKADGLGPTTHQTTVVATDSGFDWGNLTTGLALGIALSVLLGAAVAIGRNRVRVTGVAHS